MRHFVSISLLKCPKYFLGEDFDTATLSSEAAADADDGLRMLVEQLLLSLTNVLEENYDADMDIAEEIAGTLLPVMDLVNKASCASLLSVDQFANVLESLLLVLLRTNSTSAKTRYQTSTEYYRCCMYTCISHMLRYGINSSQCEAYRACSVKALEPLAIPLAYCLGNDISSPSTKENEVWSLSACSLLSLLLSTLSGMELRPSSDMELGTLDGSASYAYLQIMQIISTQDYLCHLVHNLVSRNQHIEVVGVYGNEEAYSTILGLFAHVALTSDGVQVCRYI